MGVPVRWPEVPAARCAGTGLYLRFAPTELGLRPISALSGNDPCREKRRGREAGPWMTGIGQAVRFAAGRSDPGPDHPFG